MTAYYNENDPFAAQWLRNLIAHGLIARGDVDERSIVDVRPDDLRGYAQCHFFAGIGGWSYALRLAGWPDDGPVWTGSCPCQPFSVAGRSNGYSDERHLWPEFRRLIAESIPSICFGEQVASAAGKSWLVDVRSDLGLLGFRFGAAGLCAYSVGAPHERLRTFWVADSSSDGRQRVQRSPSAQIPQDRTPQTLDAWHGAGNPFEHWSKLLAETRIDRVDDGVSSFVDIRPTLRAYGNAIVPQVAAEFIAAYMGAVAS